MAIAEDTVREALKTVIDPELFVNIVDLGLIYEVKITDVEEGKCNVDVEMTMTSPACPRTKKRASGLPFHASRMATPRPTLSMRSARGRATTCTCTTGT